MVDGKLNIKGTITIKTGKEDKEERKGKKGKRGKKEISIKGLKQRKPRKQKGTGTGIAYTGQSFEQTTSPYTAQAVMTAMALRPQLIQQPQIQQPTLEQPYRFQELLENPNIPYDAPVTTTKKELLLKAEPFLRKEIQENIQGYRQSLEDDVRLAEEDMRNELEYNRQQAEQRTEEMRRELADREYQYAREMEAKQASFQKQVADLEQQAKTEKERFALEILNERSESMSALAIEKALGELDIEQERKKSINRMSTAELRAYFRREDPSFLLGNPKTAEMREELKRREGLAEKRVTSKPPTQQDIQTFFRRPMSETRAMEDPVVKRLTKQREAEERRMSALLEPSPQQASLDESVSSEDVQRLLELYAEPQPKKYTEPRDEQFGMYMEDIRIKPYRLNEATGQIEPNPRYGLKDWTVKGKSKLWVRDINR